MPNSTADTAITTESRPGRTTGVNCRSDPNTAWHAAVKLSELEQKQKMVVRPLGKKITLFLTSTGIYACDNRCPHEGFPLVEGSLAYPNTGKSCVLTCNWHNWKFNLATGENLYGGDRLRTYPVQVIDNTVWLDLSNPPFEKRYAAILDNLKDAFEDNAYDRIAREIARLTRLALSSQKGTSDTALDALRQAIHWSYEKMEFGFTHAYAGMADWLALRREYRSNKTVQLVCLVEPFSHTAFDVLREEKFPFTSRTLKFDPTEFLRAIEQENEATAVSMILGGLKDGLGFTDFERSLTEAALAHYNDFGHSLIYVAKTGELIAQLGDSVQLPLLLALVRSLVYATREDQIPEFRDYAACLASWGSTAELKPQFSLWHKKGIRSALNTTVKCSGSDSMELYAELLTANAVSMLSFNINQQTRTRIPVSGNVTWLDFSHGITFANAVRRQCTRFPDLWPQGLLQMSCFIGRNAAYIDSTYDLEKWVARDIAKALSRLTGQVIDHGQDEHIVSVHGLKTLRAAIQEIDFLNQFGKNENAQLVFAAVNRFLNSPLKRRQTVRTAWQSLRFIEKE